MDVPDAGMTDAEYHAYANAKSLTNVLLLQAVACVGGLVLQIFCFRWYNFAAGLIGVSFLLVAFKAKRDSNGKLLKAFIVSQLVGALFVLFGAVFAFRAIQYYAPHEGYCHPKTVYYIAAVFAPVAFVCFLFAAIYARRAYNLAYALAITSSQGGYHYGAVGMPTSGYYDTATYGAQHHLYNSYYDTAGYDDHSAHSYHGVEDFGSATAGIVDTSDTGGDVDGGGGRSYRRTSSVSSSYGDAGGGYYDERHRSDTSGSMSGAHRRGSSAYGDGDHATQQYFQHRQVSDDSGAAQYRIGEEEQDKGAVRDNGDDDDDDDGDGDIGPGDVDDTHDGGGGASDTEM